MDFSVSENTQALLARAQQFVDDELIPLEPEMQKGWWHIEPLLQEKRRKVKELGLWGPNLPIDIGGMGLPLIDLGLMFEVMGQTPIGNYVFGAQAPDAGNIEILHEFGTEEQKQTWLRPLADGELRSCFAMTEPHTAGSNPTLLASNARRDGGAWVVNGHKWFTSCFDGAAFTIAMLVTDDGAARHQRASMVIIPLDTPGIEHVRNISVMGHAGEGYFSHAEIRFNDVRVPYENILGEEGQGFLIAQKRLGPGRIHHCMRWLGICKRAQKLMCEHSLAREVAPGIKLADQQIVQTWIAENAAEIEAARCMTLKAAWTGDNFGWKTARTEIGMIKYYCASILQRVVDRALQAHGSLGMTDDTPLAHWYAHERASRIYDGPDEVHKQKVAQQVLGRYA